VLQNAETNCYKREFDGVEPDVCDEMSPVITVQTGNGRQIGMMSYIIAALLIIYFVFVRTRLA
jgi:hypothetical protein